jgi:hypothetical protein
MCHLGTQGTNLGAISKFWEENSEDALETMIL